MRRLTSSVFVLCLAAACLVLCGVRAAADEGNIAVFDLDTALRLDFMNRAVNCRAERLIRWDCGEACSSTPDFVPIALVENITYGTRALVGVDHEHQNVVVAFRDSDNVQNWIADLTFTLVPFNTESTCGSRCHVHRGFYLSYGSIRDGVWAATLKALEQNPTYSVLVTGHSLGGAMASLAAADLIEWLPTHLKEPVIVSPTTTTTTVGPALNETSAPRVELYTFGSPRVGDAAFAAWLAHVLPAGKQFRITNGEDPVPHLPPRLFGYLHTPQEVWFPGHADNSTYVLCDDSVTAEERSCSHSMKSPDVHDHLNYMNMCTECICGPGDDGNDNAKPSTVMGWAVYIYVIIDFLDSFF